MTRIVLASALVTVTACSARAPAPDMGPERQEERIQHEDPDSWHGGAIRIVRDAHVTRADVPAGAAAVMRALPAAFDDVGLDLPEVDVGSGRARVQQRVRNRIGDERMSAMLECGYGPAGRYADTFRIDLTVNVAVQAQGTDASAVFVRLDARGSDPGGTSGGAVSCTTRGRLEALLLDALAARLGAS